MSYGFGFESNLELDLGFGCDLDLDLGFGSHVEGGFEFCGEWVCAVGICGRVPGTV